MHEAIRKMGLSTPAARKPLHTRRIEMTGYEREDGLYDIEGHLTDERPEAYRMAEGARAEGEYMHDLWIRITVNSDFEVVASEAAMPTGAFSICHEIAPNFENLVGLQIGPGWNRKVRERVGGTNGCTHIVEMLAQIATTAIQSLWGMKNAAENNSGTALSERKSNQINTCYAYRSDSPMVLKYYPAQYTGELADVINKDTDAA
jgi:Protein of unknown function (DUF2889)